MASFVAVFDACVLYPASVRDLLLRLALTDLFRARWTERIHDEWISAVLKQRQDLSKAQLERTRELDEPGSARLPCHLVREPDRRVKSARPETIDTSSLPRSGARLGSSSPTTSNTFPEGALASYGIEVQHPDEFVSHLFDLDPGAVCAAVRDQRESLKNPRMSVDELLNEFLARELAETVGSAQVDAATSVRPCASWRETGRESMVSGTSAACGRYAQIRARSTQYPQSVDLCGGVLRHVSCVPLDRPPPSGEGALLRSRRYASDAIHAVTVF